MKPPADAIRLTSLAREQLIKLKRQTGIQHWNILCRWALCCSLRESSAPPTKFAGVDGAVEIAWKVFAGEQSEIYASLIAKRATEDGFAGGDAQALCLKAHLHRGLGYLASEVGNPGIGGFCERWLLNRRSEARKAVDR